MKFYSLSVRPSAQHAGTWHFNELSSNTSWQGCHCSAHQLRVSEVATRGAAAAAWTQQRATSQPDCSLGNKSLLGAVTRTSSCPCHTWGSSKSGILFFLFQTWDMDYILEVLNLFSLVIFIKPTKNEMVTKSCAIFQTPHHPARVIAAPPLVLKVRELQFRPRAEWRPETGSGETQRDRAIFWMCPDLRQCWAGLGRDTLTVHLLLIMLHWYSLIIFGTCRHQQPALPTQDTASQGGRGHLRLRVGGWSSDFGFPRLINAVPANIVYLFTFYVKQQLAILWAQVTGLKTTISKQCCADNLWSGRPLLGSGRRLIQESISFQIIRGDTRPS